MSEQPIGYLHNSNTFLCPDCNIWVDPTCQSACPVFRVNIGIYSQECAKCKRLVVDGCKRARDDGPLSLFDGEWPIV